MRFLVKVCGSIIYIKLTQYYELLDIIVDEQIGSRKDGSYVDHLHTFTHILKNRIKTKSVVHLSISKKGI